MWMRGVCIWEVCDEGVLIKEVLVFWSWQGAEEWLSSNGWERRAFNKEIGHPVVGPVNFQDKKSIRNVIAPTLMTLSLLLATRLAKHAGLLRVGRA